MSDFFTFPIFLLNFLFFLSIILFFFYQLAKRYPSQQPILERAPYNRLRLFLESISFELFLTLIAIAGSLLIIFADNVFKVPNISPANELNVLVLFYTSTVLLWYSYETFLQRHEARKQTLLDIKPHIIVEQHQDQSYSALWVNIGSLKVYNTGRGIAQNVRVVFKLIDGEKHEKRFAYLQDINFRGNDNDRVRSPVNTTDYSEKELNFSIARVISIEITCHDLANNFYRFAYTRDSGIVTQFRPVKVEMPVSFRKRAKTYTVHYAKARTSKTVLEEEE